MPDHIIPWFCATRNQNNAKVCNGVSSEKSELKKGRNGSSYLSRLPDSKIVDFGQPKMVSGEYLGTDHLETIGQQVLKLKIGIDIWYWY
jgi:hypothetical protein